MANIAESMELYAQPLLEETDGSQAQLQNAYSIAQLCWNLSLLPEDSQKDNLKSMQPELNMTDAEFSNFCDTVIDPMIKRRIEMFPDKFTKTAEEKRPVAHKEKYPGTKRNDPCPCTSGKKYKKCCGNRAVV
ncbi:hypothetical protein AB833_31720 [Chromatiales bacterium (ex Bugula neritina AB1)]|nr:hypothetical protein AB833_31720 [Chromatiales bacterium (ex Bugula neritina AB1)]